MPGSVRRGSLGVTICWGEVDSPLFSGCHGEGLLAVEVVVPCGGTGGGGGCETGSECEVEGGAGGLAGGGGSGTLLRISNEIPLEARPIGSIGLIGQVQWVRTVDFPRERAKVRLDARRIERPSMAKVNPPSN